MPAGRPAKWTDPEEFDKAVDAYFESEGLHTWTGLALHLGFESRDALTYYHKEKPEFLRSIKKSLSRIEATYEKGLFERNPAGSIFALKNFGWRDRQEIDHTSKDEKIEGVDYSKLPESALRAIIAASIKPKES